MNHITHDWVDMVPHKGEWRRDMWDFKPVWDVLSRKNWTDEDTKIIDRAVKYIEDAIKLMSKSTSKREKMESNKEFAKGGNMIINLLAMKVEKIHKEKCNL